MNTKHAYVTPHGNVVPAVTNMNTKQELDNLRASYEAMGARLKELEQKHAEEQQKPWEPKGGDWAILPNGSASFSGPSRYKWKTAGSEYPTEEAAESALPYVAFFKRLCCLAQELNPSGKVGGKHYVYLSCNREWITQSGDLRWGVLHVFETKEAAKRAADIMNRDKWEVPACN